MKILIDSRESRCAVPRHLERLGYETVCAELAVGDYAVSDKLVVERKSASDLVVSILDGRLFGQAELLASSAGCARIVVEGSLSDLHSAIDPEAVAGALSALTVFFGLPVLPAPAPKHSARLVGRLARHVTEGLGYEIPLRTCKPKADGGRSQYLVEGLPGVGAETARRPLNHFGSAASVFAATETQLREMRGVGPKAAAGIVAALQQVPTAFRTTTSGPWA